MNSEIQHFEETNSPLNDLDTSLTHFDDGHSDGALSEDAIEPTARSRATSTTSHNSSSQGTIHFEPSKRRIIWEASRPSLDLEVNATTKPLEGFGQDLSQNPNMLLSSPPDSTPRQPARISSSSGSDTYNTNQSLPQGDMLLSKFAQFSSPCQIRWICTESLSFDETRGIKNAWNENKEIHIARNATAVEPQAGSTLLNLWRTKAEAIQNKRLKEASFRAWNLAEA